jgi:hypothetical protein
MAFDKQYFDDIWGNVHRHDYCETLATELIAKYNPKSFLDIGTGCGELVRVLREKGVEAYGLEISEYAVANSHGNVVLGSVTGIPFKDKSFDVVYSQGLWEYVTEQDIDRAYKECLRVGKRQEHNIDTLTDTADWSADFATHKSAEWWDEKLKQPKILVACPTHEVKDYAMQRWIDNIKSFTYPNFEVLVVDNSPNGEMITKYGDQVPMIQLDVTDIEDLMVTRINRSMELIRQHFLAGDYTHWLDIEIDVIPQPDVIEVLSGYKGDWISHAYPTRGATDGSVQQGIGCSLLSRRLLENFNWKDAEDNTTPDGWLWERVRPQVYDYPTTELYGLLKIEHLDN